jgi:hypothetical protein
MGEPIDQFCSPYNQKKPFIDFGRFLTYNTCRLRNRKAKQARHLKQKAIYKPPKAMEEEIQQSI